MHDVAISSKTETKKFSEQLYVYCILTHASGVGNNNNLIRIILLRNWLRHCTGSSGRNAGELHRGESQISAGVVYYDAKQKCPGVEKVQGQSDAALQIGMCDQKL